MRAIYAVLTPSRPAGVAFGNAMTNTTFMLMQQTRHTCNLFPAL
jgi:hypothetical protein